ncbi:MAG TPA: DUF1003 domain-containing protein [Candidatus Dormibacteraeota bacterium]
MSALVDNEQVKHTLRRRKLAAERHRHPINQAHHDDRTFGERIADRVAEGIGSWTFLIIQSALITIWISINVFGLFVAHWDPYPFILLNLMLSVQAAYAAPVLMLAGVRQATKDRLTLEHAAKEAEKGEEAIQRILHEIKRNTSLTLEILQELEG